LKEWSVLRGHLLSKSTFVEGLDLLRQDFTVENAASLADAVIERMPYRPKKLLYIVGWLDANNGRPKYSKIHDELRGMLGGELFHSPPSP